jgi:hypothetical protein
MEISWQVLMLVRFLVAGVVVYIINRVARETTLYFRAKKMMLQYAFCVLIAVIFLAALEWKFWDSKIHLMMIIGFFVSVGTYCQWGAYGISPSRASIFMIADDLIAMVLASCFLGEAKILRDPLLLFGVAMSFLAVAFFFRNDYRKMCLREKKKISKCA